MGSCGSAQCIETLLGTVAAGEVLEICVIPIRMGVGTREFADLVGEVVERRKPAAVVLNLLEFTPHFGNEIPGIAKVIYDPDRRVVRPCAIVLRASRVPFARAIADQIAGVETFTDRETAIAYMRERMGF